MGTKVETTESWTQTTTDCGTQTSPDKLSTIRSIDIDSILDELETVLSDRCLLETPEGDARRSFALDNLEKLLQGWADEIEKPLSLPTNVDTKVHVTTFGSFRLGVHNPASDMDVLCFAPFYISREEFFTSLIGHLNNDHNVTELHAIPFAYTPVLKFRYSGIAIDLLFARQSNPSDTYFSCNTEDDENTKETVDTGESDSDFSVDSRCKSCEDGDGERLFDSDSESITIPRNIKRRFEFKICDHHITGLDSQSIRSVNGVRVAQLLLDVIPCGKVPDFQIVLRMVKEWARVRGIYGNILGFLGGINWAILVAKICQMYPEATPAQLLLHFFKTFSRWSWPKPVLIAPLQHKPPAGVYPQMVWDPENPRDRSHLMPIITPAYPSMNSAFNVGLPQLRRIRSELDLARCIVEQIVVENGEPKASWNNLLHESDFFRIHANYIQINMIAVNSSDFRTWLGFCESKLRILISSLELPESGINAYPYGKIFFRGAAAKELQIEEQHVDDEADSSLFIASFFIALRFAFSAESIDLTNCTFEFLQIVNSCPDRREGMDLTIEHKLWNELPSFVAPPVSLQSSSSAESQNDQQNHAPQPDRSYLDALTEKTENKTSNDYGYRNSQYGHSQGRKGRGRSKCSNNGRQSRSQKKENRCVNTSGKRHTSRMRSSCSQGSLGAMSAESKPGMAS